MSWIKTYESEWLLCILMAELIVSCITAYWVFKEYKYDENKDLEKKQKRTKTTRKTTKNIDGSITEENTEETIMPIEGEKK